MLTDAHTHSPFPETPLAIRQDHLSWGIHPMTYREDLSKLSFPTEKGNYLAVGECGLDARSRTPIDLQTSLFRAHVALSERWQVPLIIHCVKRLDLLLALKKELHPGQDWIFHAFRGKPTQQESLLAAGFKVSFAPLFNEQSLLRCPLDRLLLESDESTTPLSDHYARVAALLGLPEHELEAAVERHFRAVFHLEP